MHPAHLSQLFVPQTSKALCTHAQMVVIPPRACWPEVCPVYLLLDIAKVEEWSIAQSLCLLQPPWAPESQP